MEWLPEPKTAAVNARYWRDEILQLMFWLRGEGLGERIDARTLTRFLGLGEQTGLRLLDQLVGDGLLAPDGTGYHGLTGAGRRQEARIVANQSADLNQPRYGVCGCGCWCHAGAEEAAACAMSRPEPRRPECAEG